MESPRSHITCQFALQEPAAELAKPAASRLATPAVPGLSPSISAGSFTVPAAVLAPGEAAEASQGAVRPQPPTAQVLAHL